MSSSPSRLLRLVVSVAFLSLTPLADTSFLQIKTASPQAPDENTVSAPDSEESVDSDIDVSPVKPPRIRLLKKTGTAVLTALKKTGSAVLTALPTFLGILLVSGLAMLSGFVVCYADLTESFQNMGWGHWWRGTQCDSLFFKGAER